MTPSALTNRFQGNYGHNLNMKLCSEIKSNTIKTFTTGIVRHTYKLNKLYYITNGMVHWYHKRSRIWGRKKYIDLKTRWIRIRCFLCINWPAQMNSSPCFKSASSKMSSWKISGFIKLDKTNSKLHKHEILKFTSIRRSVNFNTIWSYLMTYHYLTKLIPNLNAITLMSTNGTNAGKINPDQFICTLWLTPSVKGNKFLKRWRTNKKFKTTKTITSNTLISFKRLIWHLDHSWQECIINIWINAIINLEVKQSQKAWVMMKQFRTTEMILYSTGLKH